MRKSDRGINKYYNLKAPEELLLHVTLLFYHQYLCTNTLHCHNLTICSMTQFYKLLNVTVYASKVIRNMWWKKYRNECTAH